MVRPASSKWFLAALGRPVHYLEVLAVTIIFTRSHRSPGSPDVNGLGRRPDTLGRMITVRLLEGSLQAPSRKLAPDVQLYSWGDTGDWLYLIQSGWVKSMTWSQGGKPCLLGFSGPTDILGMSGYLTRRRAETAMTKTVTEIRIIARDQFQQIISEPGFRDAWHRYISAQIARQQEALTHFVTLDSEHRLAVMLLNLARNFGVRKGAVLAINCKITQDELAQMVGTTRSRVGYFLKRFEAERLLEKRPDSLAIHESRLAGYLPVMSS